MNASKCSRSYSFLTALNVLALAGLVACQSNTSTNAKPGGSGGTSTGGSSGGSSTGGAPGTPGGCGAMGQGCCDEDTGMPECVTGLGCIDSAAVPVCGKCGGLDQACCRDGLCQTGACSTLRPGIPDKCTNTCGGPGQACCDSKEGNGCATGHACFGQVMGVGGTCMPCGKSGQNCCGGGSRGCESGLGCAGRTADQPGTCGTCGAAGQACCATQGNTVMACQTGMGCITSLTGNTCGICGGAGQPCCGGGGGGGGGTSCTMGLACVGRAMGVPGMCAPCGATGQPCCGGMGASCATGNRCTADLCQPCGGMGQRCCQTMMGTVPACTTGLTCDMVGMCGTGAVTPPADAGTSD